MMRPSKVSLLFTSPGFTQLAPSRVAEPKPAAKTPTVDNLLEWWYIKSPVKVQPKVIT